MKRRIILVLGCAAVVCGVLLYLLTPYTVAPQPGYLEIHQVRRVGSNTDAKIGIPAPSARSLSTTFTH